MGWDNNIACGQAGRWMSLRGDMLPRSHHGRTLAADSQGGLFAASP